MHQGAKHYPSLSRRDLLRLAGVGLSGFGLAAIVGCGDGDEPRSATSTPLATEPPPETTRLTLGKSDACRAPLYLAEDLLPAEGFTDVQYMKGSVPKGEVDIALKSAAGAAIGVDAGDSLVVLAPLSLACWELVGSDSVQSVRDLKGKTIAVDEVGPQSSDYAFVATILTFVGIDLKDVNFVAHTKAEAIQLLAEGKIDAYMDPLAVSQELRPEGTGHVLVNSMMDRPWSQYSCCSVIVNRAFFETNPVATKRVLRAILQAADICFRDPERAARFLVDKGYTENYDYALATMKTVPYDVWRELDQEDTLRFYSLRLQEAGLIKSTPDEIIARGTDWHFLDELRQELKDA